MMARFIIINLEKIEPNLIEIECLIGNAQHKYQLKFEGIGISLPGELENAITHTIIRSERFGQIILDYHQGINLKFPIDLSNF